MERDTAFSAYEWETLLSVDNQSVENDEKQGRLYDERLLRRRNSKRENVCYIY